MDTRTDLIQELQKNLNQSLSGMSEHEEKIGNVTVSTVKITSESTAQQLNKPCGTYCTINFGRFDEIADATDIKQAIIKCLNTLIPGKRENVLVVGLGNTDITPDALGPFCANKIIATRHINTGLKKSLGLEDLKNVSCLIPGVLGKTGIEAQDMVKAAISQTHPDEIIVIDALAAGSPERLCSTIQLSNTGICPGSGVNNSRKELSRQTFGIPVTAVGMPTVIDYSSAGSKNMMVTPKEIDLLTDRAADVIARALNLFLQPSLDEATIEGMS